MDAEDVVQAVFHSIQVRLKEGTFLCDRDEGLWPLLVTRAFRRLRKENARHRAAKRSIESEVSEARTTSVDQAWNASHADRHLGPAEIAAAWDEFDRMTANLSDADRVLVYMRIEGYKLGELVRLTGQSRATLWRRDLPHVSWALEGSTVDYGFLFSARTG